MIFMPSVRHPRSRQPCAFKSSSATKGHSVEVGTRPVARRCVGGKTRDFSLPMKEPWASDQLAQGPPPGGDRPGESDAEAEARAPSRKLPHEERDHSGAGRWRRGGWRTAHERRHLVPWAQEAERIGVPPADHGGGPRRGEARDQGDVAIEVLVGRKAHPRRWRRIRSVADTGELTLPAL
jgi:hypothetical protein